MCGVGGSIIFFVSFFFSAVCTFLFFLDFFYFVFLSLLCESIHFLGRRRVLEDAHGRVAMVMTMRDDHKQGGTGTFV